MVSFIVCVYNGAKTICRCLDSLLNQTEEDIEIIVVNDGSTDETFCVLENYRYGGVRRPVHIYTKENSGQGFSRNYGLQRAKGEWISFIDADDYVDADYLKCLLDVSKNADIVVAGHTKEDGNSNKVLSTLSLKEISFLPGGGNSEQIIIENDLLGVGFPWGKLYKRKIIEKYGIAFKAYRHHEDSVFFFEYLLHCNEKISLSNNTGYHYCMYENSITHKPGNFKELIPPSMNMMALYPFLFAKYKISSLSYLRRMYTEYGLGGYRAGIYYSYKDPNVTRSIRYMQLDQSRRVFRKYSRELGKITWGNMRQQLMYTLVRCSLIPLTIVDFVLKVIYRR